MRMNYVSKHFRDHVDSEYVTRGVDRKASEFIDNKLTNKHTYRYAQFYVLVQNTLTIRRPFIGGSC